MALALVPFLATRSALAEDSSWHPGDASEMRFQLDGAIGHASTELSGEQVLPRAAHPPVGAVASATIALGWKWIAFGPRVSAGAYEHGMRSWAVHAELQARLVEEDEYRLTFRASVGHAWIRDIGLQDLGLGTYDARGVAIGFGPALSWRMNRRTALGAGARLETVFVTRPAVGPCDDAHGCNGVFYPNESGRGGIGFIVAELIATHDF